MANEVEIRIVTDTANADAQLNKLKGTTGGLNKNLLTSAKRFAVMGTAVAGAAVGIGLVTKKVFDMAANLELVENKINIVFGDQVGMVNDWADNVSKRMGLSSTQVAGLAANFADLLIPMQFTREQAAQMSTDIVGLSGALSEWSGGTRSVQEVSEILGKAMLGEREAIKSLGISITEADVKNKMLSMSTQELSGLTDAQAKALATRDLIMEKSVDAQNAYAENTDGLSVAQANLTSALETVKEEFVKELTPMLMDLADYLQNDFIPMIEEDLIPNLDKIAGVISLTIKAFKLMKPAMMQTPLDEYGNKTLEAAKATEKQREMLDEVNQAYFDFSDAALGVNQIIPLTNEQISQQSRELVAAAKATAAQTAMMDEAGQGYFDFSDEALGVTSSIANVTEAFQRLTAEQYAASVASQILSMSFADQIEFDDMFDTAVENLTKLVGQEGQLAALKRELLELAGVDFDFTSSRTERESGTTTKQGELKDVIKEAFDDTKIADVVLQDLSEDQLNARGADGISPDVGFNRFDFDFTKLFGQLGPAIGLRIEDTKEAMDTAFLQILDTYDLGAKAIEVLAANFRHQAEQQGVAFSDMGSAMRSQLAETNRVGKFTDADGNPLPPGQIFSPNKKANNNPPPAAAAAAAPTTVIIQAGVIADKQEVGNFVAGVIVESDPYKSGQLSLGTP